MTDEQNPFRDRLSLLVPINNLLPKQQEQLLAASEILTVRKREFVFHKGDRDHYSFYLLAGELEMYAGDQLIKKVSGGEGASFYPLAQLQPRQMSAKAITNAQILRIDRPLLDKLLSVSSEEPPSLGPEIEVTEFESAGGVDWLTTMLQSELFARIPPSNIQRLLDMLETVEAKAGEVIIQQGAVGDYYYAIQSGTCEVCRATSLGKAIRLAELGPGDTFGEEALVSNATRNATVRMLSDGELGRLTKEHFVELIRTPVLRGVSLATGREMVAGGAIWLDVRFPEEHRSNGMPGSVNLPLSFLRARVKELDPKLRYVAYCDTGGRSSAAAFLLTQEGFDICYVEHGAIDELGRREPAAEPAPAIAPPAPVAAPSPPSKQADALFDAEVRAQSLAADLAKATIQIEQAQRLMAEAQAAKRDAERFVGQKLDEERERISQEAAAVQAKLAEAQRVAAQKLHDEHERVSQDAAAVQASLAEAQRIAEQKLREARDRISQDAAAVEARLAEAQRIAEQKLHDERARISQDAAAVQAKLAEAQRFKDELERQHEAALQEVARQREAQDARAAELQRESERALQEKERRLEEVYHKQASQLEQLQTEQAQVQQELAQQWKQIELESSLTQERLQAAMRLEAEIQAREAEQARLLASREQAMRDALKTELARERQKLEAEFAKTAAEIARARREQQAAEAAKRAAAEEAQRIIEEYTENQQRQYADLQQKLVEGRRGLEAEALRIKREMAEAIKAKEAAEAARAAAERQLADARRQTPSSDAAKIQLRNELEAVEQRAAAAARQLREAIAVESHVEVAQRENEQRLELTYSSNNEVNLLVQKELDEWVGEQERLQSSTAQRELLAKQRAQTERIRLRAAQAKQESEQQTFSLLDEIASQLGQDL